MGDLVFNATKIRDREEMLCLTDMWRAAGAEDSQRPARWRETEAARAIIEHVETTIVKNDSACFQVVSGGMDPGTWAHWHIGMAYAKYLSPAFHVWCNCVVRAYMEGRSLVPAAVPANDALASALIRINDTQLEIAERLVVMHTSILPLTALPGRVEAIEKRLDVMGAIVGQHLKHTRKTPKKVDEDHHIAHCRRDQRDCPFCDASMFDGEHFIGNIHHHEAASNAVRNAIMCCCRACNLSFNTRPAPRHVIETYHARRIRLTEPLLYRAS